MLGKTDWYSAEKKIVLTIALAILIASVSVFTILYLMMSHALQEDIRARGARGECLCRIPFES